jgi:hypothetical protein
MTLYFLVLVCSGSCANFDSGAKAPAYFSSAAACKAAVVKFGQQRTSDGFEMDNAQPEHDEGMFVYGHQINPRTLSAKCLELAVTELK